MNSAELKRAKREVRARVRALRDSLDEATRARLGASVAHRVLELAEIRQAATVLAFWSFGSEVPTARIVEGLVARGVVVSLPRIAGSDLEVRAYSPGDPVEETPFGAMEPAGGEIILESDVDVILAPGLAFDRNGRRIGYGGGFYDRLFSRASRATRVGLAFDVQVVAEDLPGASFDLLLDVLVTESELLRFSRER